MHIYKKYVTMQEHNENEKIAMNEKVKDEKIKDKAWTELFALLGFFMISLVYLMLR